MNFAIYLLDGGKMNVPESFLKQSFQEHLEFVEKTFAGEENIKQEGDHKLWVPIVNVAVERKFKKHRDAGVRRYSSTLELLTRHMENDESRVWTARIRAVLYAWPLYLSYFMGLGGSRKYTANIPVTGGLYLFTYKYFHSQARHNDFLVTDRARILYYGQWEEILHAKFMPCLSHLCAL